MPSRQPSKLPRSHPRTAGARKKRSGASPSKPLRAIPGWLWLLAGVGVGMLVTSLVKLVDVPEPTVERPATNPAAQRQPARQAPAKAAPKTESAPPARSETRFDFYTLLPEREVIVPDEREVKPPPPPAPPKPGEPAKPAPVPASAERYLLQAGSFRREAEADRRRAQILLLGLEARIEPVQANGDTWYRVHAGPFVASDKLAQARELLSAEGIETLLLRQKPAG